jgi:hypothetical protein
MAFGRLELQSGAELGSECAQRKQPTELCAMPRIRTRDRLLLFGAAGFLAFVFMIMMWALANGPPWAVD